MLNIPKPVALIILDGWGVAAPSLGNAITSAKKPNFDRYARLYYTTTLQASGEAVGLPYGEPGNSEVGHTNLGAGKIIYQNLPKITQAIWSGSFFSNSAFKDACLHTQKNRSTLHLIGLVSNGGVHSYIEHLSALADLAKREKVSNLCLHVFLDGRDTVYNSGVNFVMQLKEGLEEYGIGKIATISGRFYAMDRDNHWERVEKTYLAMVKGEAEKKLTDPVQAIKESYEAGVYEEEFVPAVLLDENQKPIGLVKDNDAIIFFNFRGDRAKELTKALIAPDFKIFQDKC